MKEFVDFIQNIIALSDDDLQLVLSRCILKQVSKGTLLLKKGQIASEYFFIISGGVRFFYVHDNVEVTTWVNFRNEFLTEISSLHQNKPTRFNIEAIADTELVLIEKNDMDDLYREIKAWEEFGRKSWEATVVRMIEQILNFQTMSAEERYLQLMQHPEWVRTIPVKQMADVLGITPNALSRIRKNIR